MGLILYNFTYSISSFSDSAAILELTKPSKAHVYINLPAGFCYCVVQSHGIPPCCYMERTYLEEGLRIMLLRSRIQNGPDSLKSS